jgi:hypothetical protein
MKELEILQCKLIRLSIILNITSIRMHLTNRVTNAVLGKQPVCVSCQRYVLLQ